MSNNKNKYSRVLSYSLLSTFLIASPSYSANFALKEQSTTYLGLAYSGTGTLAEDSTVGYYNAASLTELENDDITLSAIQIIGKFKLNPTSATDTTGNLLTAAQTTSTTPKANAFLPSIHFAKIMNENWVASLNIATPFGLGTKYDGENSSARFMATKSGLETINISPSLAYKVNDEWSLGLGVDAIRAEVCYDAKILAGGIAGATEGERKNKGKDWGYGFHAGVLFKPTESLKMGLSYRHKYDLRLKGDSDTVNTTTHDGYRRLEADLRLPESILYSIHHQYDEKWAMMADVEWTHWSKSKELVLEFENITTGAVETSTSQNQYKNTFRISAGTTYDWTDSFRLKFGVAFDQSPLQEAHRTVRLPGSDRWWLAIGAKYKINENITLNAGYSHLFFKDSKVYTYGPTSSSTGPSASRLIGDYRSKADIIGLQITWKFV